MRIARRLTIKRKMFFSHFVAILAVSGSIGSCFYMSAMNGLMNNLKSRLASTAALVSRTLDVRDLEEIRLPDDVSRPAYTELLAKLRSLRCSNPDIAFIYIMRLEEKKVTFVIDTDESPTQAQPGQEYEEDVPPLMEGFYHPSVDDRVYTDEWGSFLSGYAPLPNGRGRYLVGIDMRADEVDRKFETIRCSGLISLVASLVLALLFSEALGSTMVRRIKALASQCRAIAQSHGGDRPECAEGDELDMLVHFFDTMSQRLEISQDDNRRARMELEQSRDKLETKVEERTRELRELNEELTVKIAERKRAEEEKDSLVAELQEALAQVKALRGLLPICSECKKIRDDRGYWNQIEAYISRHSEATFSHGICPDCASKLYPKYFPGTDSES